MKRNTSVPLCPSRKLQSYVGQNRSLHGKNITRQAVYILQNNEARSCDLCCSGKATSITQYECVFVALGIQHAMCMRHTLICDLPRSKIFSTLSHKKNY